MVANHVTTNEQPKGSLVFTTVANVLQQMGNQKATNWSPWEPEWAAYGAPAPPTLRIGAEVTCGSNSSWDRLQSCECLSREELVEALKYIA
ncbi:hypothetical protein Y032_0061g3262 [Ancylostoma ceylanicum]|uniref:Uncharacterized protein n=1 Tax=Ancylostoma ceylanicum TaxID=53326 RepID=A0A016U1U8_9BILA|nr:hypothetical protein Y032_0061g3262 [Ancylostoma ceylanicum]